MEEHFIFRCPTYYKIRDLFDCIFKESHNSLSIFFCFLNQRCLELYMWEALNLRFHSFCPSRPRLNTSRPITYFFLVLLSDEGTKKYVDNSSLSKIRSVRTKETIMA
jgi:hypothetical protein